MPTSLLTYRGTVYPWHCDHVGHMNVMWYVGKFDEATWQFFNMLGLSPTLLRSENRGMAAVDQHINYFRELHAGDIVSVHTVLIELKEKSLRFEHTMIHDEDNHIVARTTLKGVHMDTVARKSCAFPDIVRLKAAAMMNDDAGTKDAAGR